jgi:hypothetical protein
LFDIVSICNGGGYRYCRTSPLHPKSNSKGLYPLHRVLMENKIGRLLEDGEVVHHVDGDKSNDDLKNLVLLTNYDHTRLHREECGSLVELICPVCGCGFTVKGNLYRLRTKRNKTGLTCSRKCGVILGHRNRGK